MTHIPSGHRTTRQNRDAHQAPDARDVRERTPARRPARGRVREQGAGLKRGQARKLERELRRRVDGEVRFDDGTRAAYAHDASNYRQVPIAVVAPRSVDAAAEAVAVCARHQVPVLSRGGGTSLAGQCCNTAVVIDWSKYCNRVVSVDPGARRAVIEPGAVLDQVNAELSRHGLMVGPRPSTHDACTIGGMVGNNSCGASAQAYGKMSDSVERLEVLTYDGTRFWAGATTDDDYRQIVAAGGHRAQIYRDLRALRDANLALIRTRYPDIPRRVSGYNLDALLPERGFHLARALVGSESTLVTVLHAEISLVPVPAHQALVVLGYDDIVRAAAAVPRILPHRPLALEGVDDTLIDLARAEHMAGRDALSQLPQGSGWLMVRFGGDTREQADRRAQDLLDDLHRGRHSPTVSFLDDPAAEERLWKLREAGLGATAYPPGRPETHEGWEDAAVAPDQLAAYLRDFRTLLREFGYDGCSLYGHFGQGCVHTRIPFDLRDPDGVDKYRRFAQRAARLVAASGGSLSGEHGDGQSRGELLPIMFGDDVVELFARVKHIFDPGDRMNPGKVVRPHRLDDDLDLLGYHPAEPRTHFTYPHDHGRFVHAAARCVGIGQCRSHSGGVMCPSYRVTREERHTTRGRARILEEMMRGQVITDGWRSKDVLDALDLCLACKGCRGDCPVHVDMATYKAEFLAHHYARRLRPRSHYAMAWLPVWAKLAAAAPVTVNALTHAPVLQALVKFAGGVDPRRELPRFAPQRFTDQFTRHAPRPGGEPDGEPDCDGEADGRPRVVLWPDTFTNNFHPHIARAALRVLDRAGFRVEVPPVPLCCGLTWISTGQLGVAERVLRRTVRALAPRLRAGIPVVTLEPSCTAVFKSDAPELFGASDGEPGFARHGGGIAADVRRLSQQTYSLAEFLLKHAPGQFSVPPPGTGRTALAQPHCHQHAIWGFQDDAELLRRAGVQTRVLDVGCCGMAGNFGFERGHWEVSTGCAELGLWPQVDQARRDDPGTAILADGFSCRTQIEAGTDARPVHLAELLAEL
ncbi:FAD-binding and (Fe-S)-binding domain-containing protein [Actinomadura sp. NPDC047616]|uniref:FAD-binding and (Fe-S)-binding domain-containing protein n=1 Tax=Actinomadura sp. NPDC047616 TaxID=3155914 RepID=UPI0033D66D2C